jgi:AraC-like DNA-binding protein
VPEHQLRKLINRHLGYRNFSSFLNFHRIGEAKNHLVDPEFVRTPVLTIAMDLGYGSIGPFNRAFKESTGLTPTEYRSRNSG